MPGLITTSVYVLAGSVFFHEICAVDPFISTAVTSTGGEGTGAAVAVPAGWALVVAAACRAGLSRRSW